jgi:hypothetical protein
MAAAWTEEPTVTEKQNFLRKFSSLTEYQERAAKKQLEALPKYNAFIKSLLVGE